MDHVQQIHKQRFRDTFIYILGLLSLLLFMEQGFVNLWAAIIFLVYYFINYLVLSSNQDIKEKVMEWLGLNNEDNEFNSDEHFHCKRRRESSSNLSELGCYDPTDPNLIKKLNRMEALLVIRFQTNA
jgi:Ca2+/Na+ antiporter